MTAPGAGGKTWIVPVVSLLRAPGSRRREVRSGRVGELSVAGSTVPAGAEASVDAVLAAIEGGIEVAGLVTAPWRGECRRCLRPVAGELRCELRELYRARAHGESPESDEETYPLHGDHLDLAPLLRDALILELPVAPLCGAGCRGLCPSCGADLNDGRCTCPAPSGDPRWAGLEGLRSEPPR
ncbi:MAG: YceD family protein [Acidimicrobiales bacterium]